MASGSAVFVWVPNAMLYNALSVGKKLPKLPIPVRLRYPAGVGPSHGNGQHAQNIGNDCECGAVDMYTYRQTDTHTDALIAILCHCCHRQSNKDLPLR